MENEWNDKSMRSILRHACTMKYENSFSLVCVCVWFNVVTTNERYYWGLWPECMLIFDMPPATPSTNPWINVNCIMHVLFPCSRWQQTRTRVWANIKRVFSFWFTFDVAVGIVSHEIWNPLFTMQIVDLCLNDGGTRGGGMGYCHTTLLAGSALQDCSINHWLFSPGWIIDWEIYKFF